MHVSALLKIQCLYVLNCTDFNSLVNRWKSIAISNICRNNKSILAEDCMHYRFFGVPSVSWIVAQGCIELTSTLAKCQCEQTHSLPSMKSIQMANNRQTDNGIKKLNVFYSFSNEKFITSFQFWVSKHILNNMNDTVCHGVHSKSKQQHRTFGR